MYSVDTSTLVAFFAGETGEDIQLFEKFLEEELVILTCPVLAEILSDPKLPETIEDTLLSLPRVALKDGFWERVGLLRRSILKNRMKARLADALIAQNCLDHNLTLITRDRDFRKYGDLKILPAI